MNWLERTELLLGTEKINRLKNKHVLIVGMGGVGSFAAEFVARSGVGKMTIVDGDTIDVTNINRQLPALHSTVGKSKVEWMKERILDINPEIKIKAIEQFLSPQEAYDIVSEDIDCVIDCIDSISPKVNLLLSAKHKKIKCVSSMGAGGKIKGEMVKVVDIHRVNNCTMGRVVRKELRKRGVNKGIRAVFSNEPQNPDSVQLTDGSGFKKSFYGTISYMPALFGLRAAEESIRILLT